MRCRLNEFRRQTRFGRWLAGLPLASVFLVGVYVFAPAIPYASAQEDELLAPAETALGKAAEAATELLPTPNANPNGGGLLSTDELNQLLGSESAGEALLAPVESSSDLVIPRQSVPQTLSKQNTNQPPPLPQQNASPAPTATTTPGRTPLNWGQRSGNTAQALADSLSRGIPSGEANLLGDDLLGGDNLLGGSNGAAATDPLSTIGPQVHNGFTSGGSPNPHPGTDPNQPIGPAPIQPYHGYNPHAGAGSYNPHGGTSSYAPAGGAAQYNPHAGVHSGTSIGRPHSPAPTPKGKDPHEAVWTEHEYPSADTCRQCHPKHYEEWRASSHAYAVVSPMFTRFEQAMVDYTKGTVGHFCMRCHSPIATQLKLPRTTSTLDMPPVVREGVTCIVCHRVNEHYGRSNGDRRIEPGDIHAPVGAPDHAPGLYKALADAASLKLKTDASQTGTGQKIHNGSFFSKALNSGEVCTSCHQVAVHPGIWLEVVHSQYRAGPAHAKGIKCQECHMGAVPGKPYGYEEAHIAEIGGKKYGQPRRHANHNFWGPGYSIAHPGIFPHNPKARQFSPRQWMQFDYRSGWGTDAFEDTVTDAMRFPPAWESVDDRIDARRIIDANIERAQEKRGTAAMTLEAGINIDPPQIITSPRIGHHLRISFDLHNISEGHNFPTASLGAQPQAWLNVALIDPDGCRVWETGYLDTKGDLADMHSTDVAKGIVPPDIQLFNLQTKFLINNGLRGTDREAALPVNYSLDQLPFLRPGAVPVTVLNHPPFIRMEAHSIPPLGTKTAKYKIPATAFSKPGAYRLSWRMRCRTEPMYFMRQINCTPDMIRRMNENMQDIRLGSKTILVR